MTDDVLLDGLAQVMHRLATQTAKTRTRETAAHMLAATTFETCAQHLHELGDEENAARLTALARDYRAIFQIEPD